MNKEVIKAMNRKPRKEKNTFHKWWSQNGYKVMRVVLFPLWGYICVKKRIDKWLDEHPRWSEDRAKEILDYFIPRYAVWNEERKEFYFFDDGFVLTRAEKSTKKYIKPKDRKFWKRYSYKLRRYLFEDYQLEGFVKKIGNTCDDWTKVTFRLNPCEETE